MREIKFRGLTGEGKWVYGLPVYLTEYAQDHKEIDGMQSEIDRYNFDVIPETVGQYTGLKDKNGKEIYEGDLVRVLYTDWPSKSHNNNMTIEEYKKSISKFGELVWNYNQWSYLFVAKEKHLGSTIHGKHGECEVIGNIHEKQEA